MNLQNAKIPKERKAENRENKRKEVLTWQDRKTKTGKRRSNFLDSDGLMKNTEIAEALGIDSAKVRKWKCVDKWNDALENKPKKRGGQKAIKRQGSRGPCKK